MSNDKNVNQLFDEALSMGVERGVYHLVVDDAPFDGRYVEVGGKRLLFFGSGSYLGLDGDPRIKQAAISAIEQYGMQISIARTFLCSPQFDELEELLGKIFEAHVVVAPSTTMANYSALPVLVEQQDVVLLDKTVHLSVQMAARLLQATGIRVETVLHSQIDALEERIRELAPKYRAIWYMCDGIYSMQGDVAPMDGLIQLLDRHEQAHLYVDDAHGMSVMGRHGRGYALSQHPLHERMVLATSLNKAFAGQGGALVFPTAELQRRIRMCGAAMLFAYPLSPPALGASIASAKIHLSPEITQLQGALKERIELCNELVDRYRLPLAGSRLSPVRFIQVGEPERAVVLTQKLLAAGFCVNMATYPVVSASRSGIRFTLTVHHSLEDIRRLLAATAELLG